MSARGRIVAVDTLKGGHRLVRDAAGAADRALARTALRRPTRRRSAGPRRRARLPAGDGHLAVLAARIAGYNGLVVFAPRMFAHLAFGMLLAHHLDWLTPRVALAALLVVVPGWLVHGGVLAPTLGEHATWLLDLPLTVVLLVAMRPLARHPWIARPLTWLGVHSWGLYLGQILVIAAIAFPMGRAWAPAHLAPVVYALLLLGGAIALVQLGNTLRCLTSRTASVNLAT